MDEDKPDLSRKRKRKGRVRDPNKPKRVLSEKQKAALARGREKRKENIALKAPKWSSSESQRKYRTFLHEHLLKEGVKKKQASRILSDLRHDIGITKKKPRKKPPYLSTHLPQLQNPIPLALASKKVWNFFKNRYNDQFIKKFDWMVTTLGFVPPGTAVYSYVLNKLVHGGKF